MRDALRDLDREAAQPEPPAAAAPAAHGYERRTRRASSEPSSSYTFAEDYPHAALHPHDGPDVDDADPGEEFDEPHTYANAPAALRGPDPRVVQHGRATTEDLEDALAALDVDLGDIAGPDRRRSRRTASKGPRPLPGLPIERAAVDAPEPAPQPTGPQPLVRGARVGSPTGQQPMASRPAQPTGPQPTTLRPSRPTVSHAKPPPIPAAARKPPTQQVPIVHAPPTRATTDDGVLIDFDDDE